METLDSYKEILAIIVVVATAFFYLMWCYIPAILLVWRCLSLEERFPLLNTVKACLDSAWPFTPTSFRKQMRLWLELRLLHPKPIRQPGWYYDSQTKRYHLEFDEKAYRRELAGWKRNIRGKFGALKIK